MFIFRIQIADKIIRIIGKRDASLARSISIRKYNIPFTGCTCVRPLVPKSAKQESLCKLRLGNYHTLEMSLQLRVLLRIHYRTEGLIGIGGAHLICISPPFSKSIDDPTIPKERDGSTFTKLGRQQSDIQSPKTTYQRHPCVHSANRFHRIRKNNFIPGFMFNPLAGCSPCSLRPCFTAIWLN